MFDLYNLQRLSSPTYFHKVQLVSPYTGLLFRKLWYLFCAIKSLLILIFKKIKKEKIILKVFLQWICNN